jgi:hypothetical protein
MTDKASEGSLPLSDPLDIPPQHDMLTRDTSGGTCGRVSSGLRGGASRALLLLLPLRCICVDGAGGGGSRWPRCPARIPHTRSILLRCARGRMQHPRAFDRLLQRCIRCSSFWGSGSIPSNSLPTRRLDPCHVSNGVPLLHFLILIVVGVLLLDIRMSIGDDPGNVAGLLGRGSGREWGRLGSNGALGQISGHVQESLNEGGQPSRY